MDEGNCHSFLNEVDMETSLFISSDVSDFSDESLTVYEDFEI